MKTMRVMALLTTLVASSTTSCTKLEKTMTKNMNQNMTALQSCVSPSDWKMLVSNAPKNSYPTATWRYWETNAERLSPKCNAVKSVQ